MSRSTDLNHFASLNRLRWIVGLLGSRREFGWWDCDFASETGLRILGTVFPGAAFKAALASTTGAAQRLHDESLGRSGCYHLFRLPPDLEDRLDGLVGNDAGAPPVSRDAAMEELTRFGDPSITAPQGPVQIGVERKILSDASIRELAAHYGSAFRQGIRCFPYFSSDTA